MQSGLALLDFFYFFLNKFHPFGDLPLKVVMADGSILTEKSTVNDYAESAIRSLVFVSQLA